MKSSKQRRAEITASRSRKRGALQRAEQAALAAARAAEIARAGVPCNRERLAPSNSWSTPAFVERGYYLDEPFVCRDCGKDQVWTATQQRWWYEVAKGDVQSGASRCRPCRKRERERVAEARRASEEGRAAKLAREAAAKA